VTPNNDSSLADRFTLNVGLIALRRLNRLSNNNKIEVFPAPSKPVKIILLMVLEIQIYLNVKNTL